MTRQRLPADAQSVALTTPSLLSAREWRKVIRLLRLTPQQAKVVGLILQGQRDKQIATAMNLNVWTVRTHLTRIFTRLSVSDRVELILRVFRTLRESHPPDAVPRNLLHRKLRIVAGNNGGQNGTSM